MSKEEIQALLRRNTAPDKQSISTEEGLEVARAASKAADKSVRATFFNWG